MKERPGRLRVMAGAATAIVRPDGKLLIVQQEHDGVRDWGYVGGGLEDGESLFDCAVREAREETGLQVRVERLLVVTEHWRGREMNGVGFVFLAVPEPWPQEVMLPERDGDTLFLGHRWIDRYEFKNLDGLPDYDFCGIGWPEDVQTTLFTRREKTAG